MWEGFDEWAHFAYIQHIAHYRKLPQRTDAVSLELRASLQLVPLSQSAATFTEGTITHDSFWQLRPEERHWREEKLRRLPAANADADPQTRAVTQYEAQQPPLYYLLMAPPYLSMKSLSLPAQVLILRILSVLIASAVVILGYAVARRVLRGSRFPILVAVLMASSPGLFMNVCRVGNESLSMVLTGAVVLSVLKVLRSASGVRWWAALGSVIAAALMTKAYTLALLLLLPLLAGLLILKNRPSRRNTAAGFLLALLVIAAVSGWWYRRSWTATGTLSGEQLDAASAHVTLAKKVSALSEMNWHSILDTGAFSHIWIGGWSFLVLRSWIYRIFEMIAFVAAVGVLIYLAKLICHVRRRRLVGASGERVIVVVSAYLSMCFALGYNSLVAFLTYRTSTAQGWYLYAVIVAEAQLAPVGLIALFTKKRAQQIFGAVCALVIALDLYTVHFVLVPYYTGAIRHTPAGALTSFHLQTLGPSGAIGELFRRLAVNEALGASAIAGLWGAYLCATAALGTIAVTFARPRRSQSQRVEERKQLPALAG